MTGSTADILAELAAEMLHIIIAAAFRNLLNGFCGVYELVLCTAQTTGDDIIHTGGAKQLFIESL